MLDFVSGSLMAQFILNKYQDGEFILKIVLTCVAGAAIFLFFLIQPVVEEETQGKAFSVMETVRLFGNVRVLCTLPIIIYSGLSASFFYGTYSKYMTTKWIGYVMTCFGVAEAVGSVVSGKISDKVGRTPVFVASVLLAAGGYISAYFSSQDKPYLFFITMSCLGLSDSGFNTQIYSLLGQLCATQTQAAFAYFKLLQSIASASAFFYTPYLPSLVNDSLISLYCVLTVGTIFWFVLHFCLGVDSPHSPTSPLSPSYSQIPTYDPHSPTPSPHYSLNNQNFPSQENYSRSQNSVN